MGLTLQAGRPVPLRSSRLSLQAVGERGGMLPALPLILGFVAYQFALCFINTNVFAVSNALTAFTEIGLLALTVAYLARSIGYREVGFAGLIMLYFVALWVARGEIDPEGPRDVFIILCAYLLGRTVPDREVANRIIWVLSAVVLFWGAIEYCFTTLYLHYFDVLRYYIARGTADADAGSTLQADLFVSGFRDAGRNLLPFLGNQRVSSVFLEPVSMGNYGAILCLWALSFDFSEKKRMIGHLLVAAVVIVACDSRFSSMLLLILLLVRLFPPAQSRPALIALPCLMGFLIAFVFLAGTSGFSDDVSGRIARSAQAVGTMSFGQFFGLVPPDPLPDMGVAYSIEHFGLPICVALWLMFVLPTREDRRASRYRLLLAIYSLGILLISGTSLYASKTSFLAWFLYGVLSAREGEAGRRLSFRRPLRGASLWEKQA